MGLLSVDELARFLDELQDHPLGRALGDVALKILVRIDGPTDTGCFATPDDGTNTHEGDTDPKDSAEDQDDNLQDETPDTRTQETTSQESGDSNGHLQDETKEEDRDSRDDETDAQEPEATEETEALSVGHLVELLRGEPTSATAAALGSACLAHGLVRELHESDAASRFAALTSYFPRLDSLAATSPWAPYEGLAVALRRQPANGAPSTTVEQAFWRQALTCLIAEDPAVNPKQGAEQALRFLMRAQALALAPADQKEVLRKAVLSHWREDFHPEARRVALASVAPPEPRPSPAPAAEPSKAGPSCPAPVSGDIQSRWRGSSRLIAAVTGVLLLRWLGHLAGRYLLGFRHHAQLAPGDGLCRVHREVRFWGRTVREEETTFPLTELRSCQLERRYPYLHLVVGVLGLVVGAGLGVNYVVEGSFSAYPPLVLVGLSIIGAGVVLEIFLEHLVPQRRAQLALTLNVEAERLRVRLPPGGEVQPFLDWIASHVASPDASLDKEST